MNKVAKYKLLTLLGLFVVIIYCIFVRLAQYQLVQGDEFEQASLRRTMRTYTQKASRGLILDATGIPVVSNAVSFQLEFDYFGWDKATQNQVILKLCNLMIDEGQPYIDTLPITGSPFSFTTTDPENKAYSKLQSFIKTKKYTKSNTADYIMECLIKQYKLDTTDYTEAEKRIIVGVRYEMEQREFSSYTPYVFATDVGRETVSRVAEGSMLFPGVNINTSDSRQYKTPYAAHILGRVGVIYKEEYPELREKGYSMNAIIGKDGAEKAFEDYLRPIDGLVGLETDIEGSTTDPTNIKEPIPGKNVMLTIDIGMQEVAEKALASTVESIRANARSVSGKSNGADVAGGSAVVIDVNSGEILASASYPTYSLETFSADYNSLLEAPNTPMVNRPIQGIYPPGSIFKMVTILAALEEKVVTPHTIIRDVGVYNYYAPNYTPACWYWNQYGRTHGNVNASDTIKYSCNYYCYEVARIMGIDTLNSYAKQLGLGQVTGVEIAGEKAGNLAGPESREKNGGAKWELGETLSAAIGQTEQQFTPIQLVNYVATIINGGTRYKPHFLKAVYSYDGKLEAATEPTVLSQMDITPSTVDAIKKGMLGATTDDGTASSTFSNYPVQIGGKTGSIQGKAGASAHGSFLSFAPYDKPEIAVCVIIEHAGSGGIVAPVVRDIYDYYFKQGVFAAAETQNP